jgi:hypothetical protein
MSGVMLAAMAEHFGFPGSQHMDVVPHAILERSPSSCAAIS